MPRAKKISTKTTKISKQKAKTVPTIDLYRKVVISFVVLTTILILLVLYFSFVSAKITVTPHPERISADFAVDVVETEDGLVPDKVNGVFFNKEVKGEKEFSTTGSKAIASDIVGRVTVINNYRRPQALRATTRLMSSDNILLRMKDRADIPVGGTVDVDVYADDPAQLEGRTLDTGTHFNIINLWPQLQSEIYAEAATAIKLGENTVAVVTQEDIDKAKDELIDYLKLQTFVDLGLDGNVAKVVEIAEIEMESSAVVGDEVSKFILSMDAVVSGVLFDKDNLMRLAEDRMRSSLDVNKQLLSTDYESLEYSVEDLNLEKARAMIRVKLSGVSVIRLNSDIFDKDRIKGLTREQVKNYFDNQQSVESVVIKFFPFWVNRVPQLSDHINLMVK